jgi:hypothetical protein
MSPELASELKRLRTERKKEALFPGQDARRRGMGLSERGRGDDPLLQFPAPDLAQGSGPSAGQKANSARLATFLGVPYALGRSGSGLRVIAAGSRQSGDDPEDLRAGVRCVATAVLDTKNPNKMQMEAAGEANENFGKP